MIGLSKELMTDFGIAASFHTIAKVTLDFSTLPTAESAGSQSTIYIRSYLDAQAYLDGKPHMKETAYGVDFMVALSVQRSTVKTGERAAYDIVIEQDPFFADATEVN